MVTPTSYFLPRADFEGLFEALTADGRHVVGPTVAEEAVVYDEIDSAAELPYGLTAETAPGKYRTRTSESPRAFDYGIAVTAWKRFTHPSIVPLTRSRRDGTLVEVEAVRTDAPKLAFLGVRACEIAALQIQERAMRAGPSGRPRPRRPA